MCVACSEGAWLSDIGKSISKEEVTVLSCTAPRVLRRALLTPVFPGIRVGCHDFYTRRACQKKQKIDPSLVVCLVLSGSVQFSLPSQDSPLFFPEGSCSLLHLDALTSGVIKISPSTRVRAVLISFPHQGPEASLAARREDQGRDLCFLRHQSLQTMPQPSPVILLGQSRLLPDLHKTAQFMLERRISRPADRLWMGSRSLYILSTVLQNLKTQQTYDRERVQLSRADHRKIKDAHTLMLSQLDHEWTIRELATTVGLNENKLKRGFNIQFGSSVYAYLQKNRMRTAADLLHKSDDSVTDIALTVGYSSPAHFAKVFRRYHGQSPRDFRRS